MANQDVYMFEDDYEDFFSSRVKFPTKLWRIINSNTSGSICWSDLGKSISINNVLFQAEYLACPTPIFKTQNMTSFVRQLNMYGFRKVQSHQKDGGCEQVHKFRNKDFQRGRADLLGNVKRRSFAMKKQLVKKNDWKQLVNLQHLRKQYEDCLLKTPEFVAFWDIPHRSTELDLSVVEPEYRLTIIPVRNVELADDCATFTLEVPELFEHLFVDGDLQEPSESEHDDEDTDEGCDLETVELSTVTSETERKMFASDLFGEILKMEAVDSL